MKARQLIANSSYGPQQLNVIYRAFDEAWQAVAAAVGPDPAATETARLKLANIILSLAAAGNDDPEALKNAALRLLSP
jgi:hypothetical protein